MNRNGDDELQVEKRSATANAALGIAAFAAMKPELKAGAKKITDKVSGKRKPPEN